MSPQELLCSFAYTESLNKTIDRLFVKQYQFFLNTFTFFSRDNVVDDFQKAEQWLFC